MSIRTLSTPEATKRSSTGRRVSRWTAAISRGAKPWRSFAIRPGAPAQSTWVGGHYPEGRADFPVSGVSWFEASAYAAFAGKRLPVLAQWFQTAPAEVARYTVPASNISSNALAPVGTYKGIGPYGTYDTAGNVREWVANERRRQPSLLFWAARGTRRLICTRPGGAVAFRSLGYKRISLCQEHCPDAGGGGGLIVRNSRDFAHTSRSPDSCFKPTSCFTRTRRRWL